MCDLKIGCLCPTYRRPMEILNTAVACFSMQRRPVDHEIQAELIILDDAGRLKQQTLQISEWQTIRVLATKERYPSLPEKYNAMVEQSDCSHFLVWEDDDLSLRHRIWGFAGHIFSPRHMLFYRPMEVFSTYEKLHREPGWFHGSIGFSRAIWGHVGGWPKTDRPNFDQEFIGRLHEMTRIEGRVDSLIMDYVFRWGPWIHGESLPGGLDWYRNAPTYLLDDGLRHGEILLETFDCDAQRILYELPGVHE